MFAQQLMSFIAAAVVMGVVSSEVYALLKAAEYGQKAKAMGVLKAGPMSVTTARYIWSSPLLHEFFYAEVGKKPAYRASIPVCFWFTAVCFRRDYSA
ncbi:hypothetical protein ACFDR9_000596 [Janthinobacterium sp. CG_23.3]|uniref:hypothetical protein n=1 Tax=Janthinobacterium sp. CG_23.3 TaxID=3349634 RepID=UPI0038D45C9F